VTKDIASIGTPSGLSRRSLLKWGAAASAVTLGAPFIGRRAHAAGAPVRVMGVSTCAIQDWSMFKEDTGFDIEFVGASSDPGVYVQEIAANGAGDDFDLFLFDGGIEDRLGPAGFLQVIDPARLSLWGAVADDVKSSPLLTGPDGAQFGAPVVFNADSFGYRTDVVTETGDLSWSLVFENEAALGKVAIEDTWLTTLPNAALYLMSKGMAIGNPSDMTPEEVKAVVDFLIERKKAGQFRAFWGSYEESVDLLGNGEVVIEQCWEPVIKQLQREDKAVDYALVKEGYSKWMIGAYIPSQAEGDRLDRAYRTIDWFLGGRYGALMAIQQGYATSNPSASLAFAKQEGMSAEEIAAIEANVVKVERKMKLPYYWQNSSPKHVDVIEAEWQRFKQA
jgi:spermidine/putrescine-binding protein